MIIGAICFLAIVPFFWHGIPSGHDFEFHMYSWMEVLGQWKQGIVYPRWAGLAHWGYGEARFVFYPPASWILGAGLGAILPWKVVPGGYVWIALTLAGLSMFRLAREWLPLSDALFAAVFYAVNPYHLVIVYWRSAYAELLAGVLLPLLVLCVVRMESRNWRPVLGLGLTLCAAWLTNAPAAVMVHYSLAALIGVRAVLDRSWRPLAQGVAAISLGAGLAAFYLVPAYYEQKWVNIGEILAPGVRPQDNFLFTTIADPDHNRFNLMVSTVALAAIIGVAIAVWFSRTWRKTQRGLWTMLLVWAGMASLVMFSITNRLWAHLPELRFVQLPWRWLLCLNCALALLMGMARWRWRGRALFSAGLLAVVLLVGYRIQPPWWDTAADIREIQNAMANGTGMEGTDEYVPAGADPYEVNQSAPFIVNDSGRPMTVEEMTWGPLEKYFVIHVSEPETMTLRLFNYPAWGVTVNGRSVETQTADVTGQMVIPVSAGSSDVRIRFRRTKDRTVGNVISLAFLVGGILSVVWGGRKPDNDGEHRGSQGNA